MPARMTKARVMIILLIRGQRVMLDRDLAALFCGQSGLVATGGTRVTRTARIGTKPNPFTGGRGGSGAVSSVAGNWSTASSSQLAVGEHGTGIVDQHMQVGVALLESGGSLHDD